MILCVKFHLNLTATSLNTTMTKNIYLSAIDERTDEQTVGRILKSNYSISIVICVKFHHDNYDISISTLTENP